MENRPSETHPTQLRNLSVLPGCVEIGAAYLVASSDVMAAVEISVGPRDVRIFTIGTGVDRVPVIYLRRTERDGGPTKLAFEDYPGWKVWSAHIEGTNTLYAALIKRTDGDLG